MTRYVLACVLSLPSLMLAQTSGGAKTAGSDVAASASTAAKETWTIDTSHSELAFNLRLFAGRTQGRFNVWSGTIAFPSGKSDTTTSPSDKWNDAVVDVVIQVPSVDTKNKKRDDHLRNQDFFDVEKYPVMTFKSTGVKRTGDSVAVAGNLTIKNVTKPIVLKGKFLGVTPGPKPRMNFQATVTINRLDYGVNYENILVRDGTALGEDVTIDITVAAVRQ